VELLTGGEEKKRQLCCIVCSDRNPIDGDSDTSVGRISVDSEIRDTDTKYMDLISEPDTIYDLEITVPDETQQRMADNRECDEIRFQINGEPVRLVDRRDDGTVTCSYTVVWYGGVTQSVTRVDSITEAVLNVTETLKLIKDEYAE